MLRQVLASFFVFYKADPFPFETGDLIEFKLCGMEGHFWKGAAATISKYDGDSSAHLFMIEKEITDHGVVMVKFNTIDGNAYFQRYYDTITLNTGSNAPPLKLKPTLSLNGHENCWSFSDNVNGYDPNYLVYGSEDDKLMMYSRDSIRDGVGGYDVASFNLIKSVFNINNYPFKTGKSITIGACNGNHYYIRTDQNEMKRTDGNGFEFMVERYSNDEIELKSAENYYLYAFNDAKDEIIKVGTESEYAEGRRFKVESAKNNDPNCFSLKNVMTKGYVYENTGRYLQTVKISSTWADRNKMSFKFKPL